MVGKKDISRRGLLTTIGGVVAAGGVATVTTGDIDESCVEDARDINTPCDADQQQYRTSESAAIYDSWYGRASDRRTPRDRCVTVLDSHPVAGRVKIDYGSFCDPIYINADALDGYE